jgi:hypothetical protein
MIKSNWMEERTVWLIRSVYITEESQIRKYSRDQGSMLLKWLASQVCLAKHFGTSQAHLHRDSSTLSELVPSWIKLQIRKCSTGMTTGQFGGGNSIEVTLIFSNWEKITFTRKHKIEEEWVCLGRWLTLSGGVLVENIRGSRFNPHWHPKVGNEHTVRRNS